MKTKVLLFCLLLSIFHVSCGDMGKPNGIGKTIDLSPYDEGFYVGYCLAWDDDFRDERFDFREYDHHKYFYRATNVRRLILKNGSIPTLSLFRPSSLLKGDYYGGAGLFHKYGVSNEYREVRRISSQSDLQQFNEYCNGLSAGIAKMKQIRNTNSRYYPSITVTDEIRNNEYFNKGWDAAYNGIHGAHDSFEILEGVPLEEEAWNNFSYFYAGFKAGHKERYPNGRLP